MCLEDFFEDDTKRKRTVRELMISSQTITQVFGNHCLRLDCYNSFCISGLPATSVLQYLFVPCTSTLGYKSLQRRARGAQSGTLIGRGGNKYQFKASSRHKKECISTMILKV